MADETYYEILDVPRTAGQDRILTSYRSLAKQFHPDREPGVNPGVRKLMTRRFQQVSEAYSTLKDPAKRREYDAALDMLESPEYYQPMVVQPPPHSSSPSPVRRASPKWQPLWASNNLRGMSSSFLLAIGTIFCLAAILPLVLMCLDPSGKKAAAAPTVQATPTVRKAPAPVVVKPATVAPAPVVRPVKDKVVKTAEKPVVEAAEKPPSVRFGWATMTQDSRIFESWGKDSHGNLLFYGASSAHCLSAGERVETRGSQTNASGEGYRLVRTSDDREGWVWRNDVQVDDISLP
jgi:curved DNA-binding protein CbpA